MDVHIQGLGLLINLVEYSSRNRHCLVELEVNLSGLPETEKDVKVDEEKEVKKEEDGMEEKKEKRLETLSALAALVQVCLELVDSLAHIVCLLHHYSSPGGSSIQESLY